MEFTDNRLQGIGSAIQVVAVQLHGKPSAGRMADGKVPASAYTQVFPLGDEVDEVGVSGIFPDGFGGAVGRMVVYYQQVEVEVGLLLQHRADGVFDGAYPVVYGDDDGSLAREIARLQVDVPLHRRQISPCLLQVPGESGFPFFLYLAVARVYIVELLLARAAGIRLCLGIEVFADMGQGVTARHAQPYGIACRVPVIGLHADFGYGLSQRFGAEHDERTEIEIVAYASGLVIDDGMRARCAFGLFIAVGIYHAALRDGEVIHHAFQGAAS